MYGEAVGLSLRDQMHFVLPLEDFLFRGKCSLVHLIYFSTFIIVASSFIGAVSSLHDYYLGHLELCLISFKLKWLIRVISNREFILVDLFFSHLLVCSFLLLMKLATSFSVFIRQHCCVAFCFKIVAPIMDGYPLEFVVRVFSFTFFFSVTL